MSGIYKTEEGRHAVLERYLALLDRWPVPSQRLRVPTRHGETFVVASGPEHAPPVLLLQGSGGNTVMWMRDIASWSEHHRVYAVDVIGEPGLSAPSRPDLASDAYALWLDDVLQALGLARASFVGVSLGGWFVLDYATRRPDRVCHAVVISPAGIGRQRVGFLLKAGLLMLLGRWGRRKAMAMALGTSAAKPDAVGRDLGLFALLIFKHFRPRRVRIPAFSDDALTQMTVPVMAIVGAQDALLDSDETRRRLEKQAPRATVRWLPDAGHFVRDQGPAVLEFISGEQGPAAAAIEGPTAVGPYVRGNRRSAATG